MTAWNTLNVEAALTRDDFGGSFIGAKRTVRNIYIKNYIYNTYIWFYVAFWPS